MCGIAGGLVLAFCAWAGTGALTKLITPEEAQFARDVAPWAANAVLPTPVPGDCDVGPNAAAYKALKRHRPDVLKFYAQNGFNPETQCRAAFDDWTSHGEQGRAPTTVVLYAAAQGWIPQPTPTPTPTPSPPPADCKAPADVVASVGFDPYAILVRARPDVLQFYMKNGWDPQTKCVAIYDDWLSHGEQGRPPSTAVAYVRDHGLAPAN